MQQVIEFLDQCIDGATRRKIFSAVTMYKTFKAELVRKFGKTPTWDEAAALAKTQIGNYEKAEKEAADRGLEYTPPLDEIEFLQEFIPQQMSENEIRSFFATSGLTNKGKLMKAIKDAHPNKYDGALAAQIAGEFNATDKFN